MITIKRIIKFQIFNWLGSVLNFTTLWLLHGIMDFSIIAAGLCAIELAIIHNFTWHYLITWKDRVEKTVPDFFKRLLQYNILISSTDLILNLGVLYALTEYFGVHYLAANLLGMLAGPFVKFMITEFGVFRKTVTKKIHPEIDAYHDKSRKSRKNN